MGLRPDDWSVVIVGRWNRAILTPGRIARHVFEIGDAKQVEVLVPIDGISPYVVRHPSGGFTVAATDENRLLFNLDKADFSALQNAMEAGVKTLDWLPQTPVSAAGFNVNFRTTEVMPPLAAMLANDIVDRSLGDTAFKVPSRALSRMLQFEGGSLNLNLSSGGDDFKLAFNFHRNSTDQAELIEWLRTPMEKVKDAVDRIVRSLNLEIEETDDGDGRE